MVWFRREGKEAFLVGQECRKKDISERNTILCWDRELVEGGS